MSKVLNQHPSNHFFQIAGSSRKKIDTAVLSYNHGNIGIFLISWLFNSNSLPLDIVGNMPIKQVVSDYEFKGKFAFVDKNMETQIETLKQKREYFIKYCVKFNAIIP